MSGGHPYVTTEVDRYKFIARMALAAVPLASGLHYIAAEFAGDVGVAIASPSALLLFGAVFWLYDHKIWRLRPFGLSLSPIPDLEGYWEGTVTLRAPGQPSEEHEAIRCQARIWQTWSRILILFSTDRNRSESLSAVLGGLGSAIGGLHYHYQVSWHDPSVSRHVGFQQLSPRLGDWDHLVGEFFTDRHFLQYGELDLRRIRR